jgi:hypothetical protein
VRCDGITQKSGAVRGIAGCPDELVQCSVPILIGIVPVPDSNAVSRKLLTLNPRAIRKARVAWRKAGAQTGTPGHEREED